jgi:hypothetical protein
LICFLARAQNVYNSAEKIYSITNSQVYTAGEEVFFANHILNEETGKPSFLSQILYIYLIDAENIVFMKQKLRVDRGTAYGQFKLPDNLVIGRYFLVSATTKSIKEDKLIPSVIAIDVIQTFTPRFHYQYEYISDLENQKLIQIKVVDDRLEPIDGAKISIEIKKKNKGLKKIKTKTDIDGVAIIHLDNIENLVTEKIYMNVEHNKHDETFSLFIPALDTKFVDKTHKLFTIKDSSEILVDSNILNSYKPLEEINVTVSLRDLQGQPLRSLNSLRVANKIRFKKNLEINKSETITVEEAIMVGLSEDLKLKIYKSSEKKHRNQPIDTSIFYKSEKGLGSIAFSNNGYASITPVTLKKLSSNDTIVNSSLTSGQKLVVMDDFQTIEKLISSIQLKNLPFTLNQNKSTYTERLVDEFSFESLNILNNVLITSKRNFIETKEVDIFSGEDYVCYYGIINCSNHDKGTIPILGDYYLYERGSIYVRLPYVKLNEKIPESIIINGFDEPKFPLSVNIPDEYSFQDLRTVLYWNPIIISNTKGEINFTFTTSEIKGTYIIQIFGFDLDGQRYDKRLVFEVK